MLEIYVFRMNLGIVPGIFVTLSFWHKKVGFWVESNVPVPHDE